MAEPPQKHRSGILVGLRGASLQELGYTRGAEHSPDSRDSSPIRRQSELVIDENRARHTHLTVEIQEEDLLSSSPPSATSPALLRPAKPTERSISLVTQSPDRPGKPEKPPRPTGLALPQHTSLPDIFTRIDDENNDNDKAKLDKHEQTSTQAAEQPGVSTHQNLPGELASSSSSSSSSSSTPSSSPLDTPSASPATSPVVASNDSTDSEARPAEQQARPPKPQKPHKPTEQTETDHRPPPAVQAVSIPAVVTCVEEPTSTASISSEIADPSPAAPLSTPPTALVTEASPNVVVENTEPQPQEDTAPAQPNAVEAVIELANKPEAPTTPTTDDCPASLLILSMSSPSPPSPSPSPSPSPPLSKAVSSISPPASPQTPRSLMRRQRRSLSLGAMDIDAFSRSTATIDNFRLRAAGLDDLIRLFLSPAPNTPAEVSPQCFHDLFLVTHPSFLGSDVLLEHVIEAIRRCGDRVAEQEALASLFCRWIKLGLVRTMQRFPKIGDRLHFFLESFRQTGWSVHVSQMLKDEVRRVSSAHIYRASQSYRAQNVQLLTAAGEEGNSLYFLLNKEVTPLCVAQMLTHVEFELFSSIGIHEFLNGSFRNNLLAPAYAAFFAHFNNVTYWIASKSITIADPKLCGRLLSKWIKIALALRQLNNYSGLLQVLSALGMGPVRALKPAWRSVSSRLQVQLDQLQQLMSPIANYELYRNALNASSPPAIPFLGIFTKDLTYLDDAFRTFTDDCVNFEKMALLGKHLITINIFQRTPYDLSPVVSAKTNVVSVAETIELFLRLELSQRYTVPGQEAPPLPPPPQTPTASKGSSISSSSSSLSSSTPSSPPLSSSSASTSTPSSLAASSSSSSSSSSSATPAPVTSVSLPPASSSATAFSAVSLSASTSTTSSSSSSVILDPTPASLPVSPVPVLTLTSLPVEVLTTAPTSSALGNDAEGAPPQATDDALLSTESATQLDVPSDEVVSASSAPILDILVTVSTASSSVEVNESKSSANQQDGALLRPPSPSFSSPATIPVNSPRAIESPIGVHRLPSFRASANPSKFFPNDDSKLISLLSAWQRELRSLDESQVPVSYCLEKIAAILAADHSAL